MKSFSRLLLDLLVAYRPVRSLLVSASKVGISAVTLRLARSSPLFQEGGGELLELPVDQVIAPWVLEHGYWEKEEIDFAVAHAPHEPVVLLDIGANVGLITRQLMHLLPNITAAVCYEPHPRNFELLGRNLAHLKNCFLVPHAVGFAEGELHFYEDLHNAGNYSLNVDAMRGRHFRESSVTCVRACDAEILGRLPPQFVDAPIIWKSDTQGFDELIATAMSEDFWSRVRVVMIEISRIRRPDFDTSRFSEILAGFPVRHFAGSPAQVSVEEILQFLKGDDAFHKELLLAKQEKR